VKCEVRSVEFASREYISVELAYRILPYITT
jgi:hypothetical protein